jgi:hypothetical protein
MEEPCEICETETTLTETEGLEICFDCRLALGFVTVYKSTMTKVRPGNYHMNGVQAAPVPPRPH